MLTPQCTPTHHVVFPTKISGTLRSMAKRAFFLRKSHQQSDESLPLSERRSLNLRFLTASATCLLMLGAFVLPSSYSKEGPGPLFDILGQYQDQDIIQINGTQTYPTTGKLNMTTVSVSGGPYTVLPGADAFYSWLATDGNRYLVVPSEITYPHVTHQQANQVSSAQMADSQTQAKVAAARYLKMPVTEKISVLQTASGSPAEGQVQGGDRILKVGDKQINTLKDVTETVQASEGRPVTFEISRNGENQNITLTPRRDDKSGRWLVGIVLKQDFDLPFDVTYNLDGVGGPSAGLMLTLGTIDKLTEQSLLAPEGAGNEDSARSYVAGTGTIDASGKVGAIGGIKYKIIASGHHGAHYFLAPRENCGDLQEIRRTDPDVFKYYRGETPAGDMQVIPVDNVDEAVDALTKIKNGAAPEQFPTCG